jgi:hypothetical protein
MNDMMDRLNDKEAMGFISKVEEPFKNLPHLPKGLVEFFVKVAPWLALISAILGLISGPLLVFLGSIGSLFTLSPMLLIGTVGSVVILVVNSILLLMAFNPLKNREMKGWVLLFWSNMLGIISAIFSLLGGSGGIVGSVVGVLIGLYVLFEMKPFYGGAQAAATKVKNATK